jgi:hypothetical protein
VAYSANTNTRWWLMTSPLRVSSRAPKARVPAPLARRGLAQGRSTLGTWAAVSATRHEYQYNVIGAL